MEHIIAWEEYSNSEIETKLKTLAFQYEKQQNEINDLIIELDSLNKNYNKGKLILEKRLNPSKFKK